MVRTQHFSLPRVWVLSLVGDLRSYKPRACLKKKKKIQRGKDLLQDCCDETVEEGTRVAGSRASDLNPRAQQPPGFTCSPVLSFPCCWLASLALHWVWCYTPVFTWRIWVLGVSLDSSPAPFPASRKRYLGRRAALGHLNTTVLAAWPLLRRRRRPQVKPTGGVLPGGGAGEKPASLSGQVGRILTVTTLHAQPQEGRGRGLRDRCWRSVPALLPGGGSPRPPGAHRLPSCQGLAPSPCCWGASIPSRGPSGCSLSGPMTPR